MATYYDEDQNPIETLTPEEVTAIQEKAAKAEELEVAMAEKEEELAKLRAKDTNFTKFREKTEAEREKLIEDATGEKKMLLEEINTNRKEKDAENKAKLETAKESMLEQLAGKDADLRKAIELRAKEWGEPKTPEEVFKKYSDAYTLQNGSRPSVNLFNNFAPATSYQAAPNPKPFVETDSGKTLYGRMFPSIKKD